MKTVFYCAILFVLDDTYHSNIVADMRPLCRAIRDVNLCLQLPAKSVLMKYANCNYMHQMGKELEKSLPLKGIHMPDKAVWGRPSYVLPVWRNVIDNTTERVLTGPAEDRTL